MSFYPAKISEKFNAAENSRALEKADASGRWASFVCGISVKFFLVIEAQTKLIKKAGFKSNGCGYAVASADFMCEKIAGQKLTELHNLENLELELKKFFGEFPTKRKHCSDVCFEALQQALSAYRELRVEEWTGEKALICTCFGVSEERIESEIEEKNLETVEDVGDICSAGTGCGSCQPMIQEILDSQNW